MDVIVDDRRDGTASRSSRTTRTGSSAAIAARRSGPSAPMATQSFHETKNFTCGEGGALVINDPRIRRARRDPSREGHEPAPLLPRSGRQVHVGRRRLELPALRPARRDAARPARGSRVGMGAPEHHLESLRDRSSLTGRGSTASRCRSFPNTVETPYHLFHMIMPSAESRDALINHLRAAGILAVFHYQPLHLSPFGRQRATGLPTAR